jgi:DNA invertase Pin-like site-specific DNA recombinase
MTLPRKTVKRVLELHFEFFPQRDTAKRLRIAHRSVKNIIARYKASEYEDIVNELKEERPEIFE